MGAKGLEEARELRAEACREVRPELARLKAADGELSPRRIAWKRVRSGLWNRLKPR